MLRAASARICRSRPAARCDFRNVFPVYETSRKAGLPHQAGHLIASGKPFFLDQIRGADSRAQLDVNLCRCQYREIVSVKLQKRMEYIHLHLAALQQRARFLAAPYKNG